MKINFASKTIEITKTFADKASHFGSEEYHALRTATCDLPDFEVAIKVTAKPRRTYMKGLSYEFMESFIALNDEDGSIMQDFQCLRQGCSYAEIKRWFFAKFPEVNNFAAYAFRMGARLMLDVLGEYKGQFYSPWGVRTKTQKLWHRLPMVSKDRTKSRKSLSELSVIKTEEKAMIYGYARVSTAAQCRDGNSLEDQVAALEKYGCQEIVKEAFTGKTMERPKFLRLLEVLQEGDTLVVCKLDRFARTAIEGVQVVRELFERGIRVHILNMGLVENTLTGNLILTVMLAFAEYERGMKMHFQKRGCHSWLMKLSTRK